MNPTIVDITDLDHQGRGVGRIDDQQPVIFVRGALPQERVEVGFIGRKKNFWHGVATAILQPSPDRLTPPCPHATVCGGCSLQHLSASAQIHRKQKWLSDNLARIGEVSPSQWAEPILAPTTHYRRRARLSVKWVEKKNKVLVGFHEKGGRYIADIQSCLVLSPPFADLLHPLAQLIAGLSAKREIPQIEISVGERADGAIDPMMVVRHLSPLSANDQAALIAFTQSQAIALYLQPSATKIHLVSPNDHQPAYFLPEYGVRIGFSPVDFLQINREGNRAMVQRALEWLDWQDGDRLIDAFCGLGNFSLALAKCVKNLTGGDFPSIHGIEGNAELIDRARHNARNNGLEAICDWSVDNLFEPSIDTQKRLMHANKLLLDPPRDGAMALCQNIPDSIERIVYVSCHPATLARDAKILTAEKGFRLIKAGVIDMFAHTNHLESIALLTR